jgi:hypothetical protein
MAKYARCCVDAITGAFCSNLPSARGLHENSRAVHVMPDVVVPEGVPTDEGRADDLMVGRRAKASVQG